MDCFYVNQRRPVKQNNILLPFLHPVRNYDRPIPEAEYPVESITLLSSRFVL